MSRIFCHVISCSSDTSLNVSKLLVWGEGKHAGFLSQTSVEIKKRLADCQKEVGCEPCDAEIHKFEINRTEKTYKQLISEGR